MIVFLVAAAAGGLYGRVPAAVAMRVFQDRTVPLLTTLDFRRPLAVAHSSPSLTLQVQLVCATLFGATSLVIGEAWSLIAYLWFIAVTVTITLTDLDRKLVPNRILLPGSLVGAALLATGAAADGDLGHLGRAIGGAAAYFAFLFVLALTARGGFGMGDVKLGAFLGAFLGFGGWATLVVGVVWAFLLGGAVAIFLLVFRMRGRKDAIPFGPYLVVGAYLALAVGESGAGWYRG